MRRRRPVRPGLRPRPVRSGLRPDLRDDQHSVHSSVRRAEIRRRQDRLRRQKRESLLRRENRVLQTGLRRRMRSVRPGLRSRSGSVRSGVLMIARSKFKASVGTSRKFRG